MAFKNSSSASRWATVVALTLMLAAAAACSKGGSKSNQASTTVPPVTVPTVGPGSDAPADSPPAAITTTVNVVGQLNLSLGLALADNEMTIKATYAANPETKGTIGADGKFNIQPLRKTPFSMTVFDASGNPIATFIFKSNSKASGSASLNGDVTMPALDIVDGKVEVPEAVTAGQFDEQFKADLAAGKMSEELSKTLFNADGLQPMMLGQSDEYGNGQKGQGNGPQGGQGNGPQGGQGNGPQNSGPMPTGAGPGCNGPNCGPVPVDAKTCSLMGYSPFNPGGAGGNNGGNDGGAPTLFVHAEADGTKTLVVQETKNGAVSQTVFPNLDLTGTGDTFTLIGDSPIPESDIKSRIAGDVINSLMMQAQNGSFDSSPPSFIDPSLDPLYMMQMLLQTLHRMPYPTKTVLKFDNQGGGFNNPGMFDDPNKIKTCTELAIGSADPKPLLLKDFCFDANGAVKASFNLGSAPANAAATSLCSVAAKGGPYRYRITLKNPDGSFMSQCVRGDQDEFGHVLRTVLSEYNTETACRTQQSQVNQPQMPGVPPKTWINWEPINADSATDCSVLRMAGTQLLACTFNGNPQIEPNFNSNHPNIPYPSDLDNAQLSQADGLIAQAQEKSKTFDQGTQGLKNNIESAKQRLATTVASLARSREKLNNNLYALNVVATAKDASGQLLYVKASVDGAVRKDGDFSMTQEQVTALQTVLGKADKNLEDWTKAVTDILAIYDVMSAAASQSDASATGRCLIAEVESQARFEALYHRFDLAINGGVLADGTKFLGISKFSEKSARHEQCMNMDMNINNIRRIGLSAPSRGAVHAAAPVEEDLALNEAPDTAGKSTEVSCRRGAESYVTFGELVSKAAFDEGCNVVTQKLSMVGQYARAAVSAKGMSDSGPVDLAIPVGDIFPTTVNLMTRMKNKDCKLAVLQPAVDPTTGCWVYTNAAGTALSSLSDDEFRAADPSSFHIKYSPSKVSMKSVLQRQKLFMSLHPIAPQATVEPSTDPQADDAGL